MVNVELGYRYRYVFDETLHIAETSPKNTNERISEVIGLIVTEIKNRFFDIFGNLQNKLEIRIPHGRKPRCSHLELEKCFSANFYSASKTGKNALFSTKRRRLVPASPSMNFFVQSVVLLVMTSSFTCSKRAA